MMVADGIGHTLPSLTGAFYSAAAAKVMPGGGLVPATRIVMSSNSAQQLAPSGSSPDGRFGKHSGSPADG